MILKDLTLKVGVGPILGAVMILVLTVTAQGFASNSAFSTEFAGFFNGSDSEEEIFDLINAERSKKSLGRLEWNDKLARVARSYSRQMARESFFGHFDREGRSVSDRVAEAKITGWRKIGENLFYCDGYESYAGVAVKGWMRSTDHRRNILDRNYTTSGIGVHESKGGEVYITQVFMQD